MEGDDRILALVVLPSCRITCLMTFEMCSPIPSAFDPSWIGDEGSECSAITVQIAIETGVGRSAIVNFHSFVCDHCYYLCATSEISLYTDRLNSREIDSRACTKLAIVANSRMSNRYSIMSYENAALFFPNMEASRVFGVINKIVKFRPFSIIHPQVGSSYFIPLT